MVIMGWHPLQEILLQVGFKYHYNDERPWFYSVNPLSLFVLLFFVNKCTQKLRVILRKQGPMEENQAAVKTMHFLPVQIA